MQIVRSLKVLLKLIKAGGFSSVDEAGGIIKVFKELRKLSDDYVDRYLDDTLALLKRGDSAYTSKVGVLSNFVMHIHRADAAPALTLAEKAVLSAISLGTAGGVVGGGYALYDYINGKINKTDEAEAGSEGTAAQATVTTTEDDRPTWAGDEEASAAATKDLSGYSRSTSGDAMFIDAVIGGSDQRINYGIVGEEAKHKSGVKLDGIAHIIGTDNADRIVASADADQDNVFVGEGGNDRLEGGRGQDLLDGGDGNDWLDGGADDDMLLGGNGNDVLLGGDGNDALSGGAGGDILHGGEGNDTVDYSDSSGGIRIDLQIGKGYGGDATSDEIIDIEHVVGSAYDDTITAKDDDTSNLFMGGDGKDILDGRGGNDMLRGEAGEDILHGGDGDDVLEGGYDNDTLYGDAGEDLLIGGLGNDKLYGGVGNDALHGSRGADHFDGGEGEDLAMYIDGIEGVTVDLESGEGRGGDAEGDTLVSIEHVMGTDHDDALLGNVASNMLVGGKGDDTLHGRAGDDLLIGGAGADIIDGGDGEDTAVYADSVDGVVIDLANGTASGGEADGDTLTGIENVIGSVHADKLFGTDGANKLSGGAGGDMLYGRGGDDVLEGGAGADIIDGGNGEDTVSYANSDAGVEINLATGQALFGHAHGDTLSGIEHVIGSAHDDVLMGDANANKLEGGEGNDALYGGAGSDTFIFSSDWGSDVIMDFSEDDAIELDAANYAALDAALANAIQDGNDVRLDFGDGNVITFANIQLADLSHSDFRALA